MKQIIHYLDCFYSPLYNSFGTTTPPYRWFNVFLKCLFIVITILIFINSCHLSESLKQNKKLGTYTITMTFLNIVFLFFLLLNTFLKAVLFFKSFSSFKGTFFFHFLLFGFLLIWFIYFCKYFHIILSTKITHNEVTTNNEVTTHNEKNTTENFSPIEENFDELKIVQEIESLEKKDSDSDKNNNFTYIYQFFYLNSILLCLFLVFVQIISPILLYNNIKFCFRNYVCFFSLYGYIDSSKEIMNEPNCNINNMNIKRSNNTNLNNIILNNNNINNNNRKKNQKVLKRRRPPLVLHECLIQKVNNPERKKLYNVHRNAYKPEQFNFNEDAKGDEY